MTTRTTDGGEYEMGEVYDTDLTAEHWSDPEGSSYETTLTADHWSDREGNRLPIGELRSRRTRSSTRIAHGRQARRGIRGLHGQRGHTLDRWYRHAAIVLWPEGRHFEIICSRDSRGVVPELVRMIAAPEAGRRRTGPRPRKTQRCLELAAAILARWPEQSHARSGVKTSAEDPRRAPAGMPRRAR